MIQQTPPTTVPSSSPAGESPGMFVDRRQSDLGPSESRAERRQFRDGNRSVRPEVAEFADAVDEYKVLHRRRFITYEELFDVMTSLGYTRPDQASSAS